MYIYIYINKYLCCFGYFRVLQLLDWYLVVFWLIDLMVHSSFSFFSLSFVFSFIFFKQQWIVIGIFQGIFTSQRHFPMEKGIHVLYYNVLYYRIIMIVCIYIYIYICISLSLSIYIYMYMYMYIHIHNTFILYIYINYRLSLFQWISLSNYR